MPDPDSAITTPSSTRIWATTLADLLLHQADVAPDSPLLVFPDSRHSYAEMASAAYERALSLYACGVRAGDHVGILMPNTPEYLELLFGAALLGAITVPMNARYKSQELAYVVENADLVALVSHDMASEYVDFAQLLQGAFPDLTGDGLQVSVAAAPKLKTLVMLGGSKPEGFMDADAFAALGHPIAQETIDEMRLRVSLRDPCIMMYTSGTTANPKGCPLSHEALVRNGMNMNRSRYFLTEQDRFWAPLPMFHMSSILPLIACMDAGAALLSMTRIEAGEALAMMGREKVTVAFPAFPTVTNELINHPTFASTDLSQLRRINNVAPIEVLRRFQEAFPQAVQTGAYGLTEVSGVIAYNLPDESLEDRLHTCGPVMPGIEAKVVQPETLEELPRGERGEILIRGYCLFNGYYKSPEKNAEAFVDGWFRTGDLCSLDEAGRIGFHGRIKDMLKVGGENVASIEIESFLSSHPAVKMAQVIGMPDDRLLEVPAAFIEIAPNAQLTEAELIEFCQGQIASFKIPRKVVFMSEWPMSSTKIQKYRLLELL